MKIDDRVCSYQIGKHLPKSAQRTENRISEKNNNIEGTPEEKKDLDQDAIVNLSSVSKETRLVREILAVEPDIRMDKISTTEEKIRSGAYRLDYEAIADKLYEIYKDDLD